MPRFLSLVLGLCVAALARAEIPSLLADALKKTGEEEGRWAYTETSSEKDDKGKSSGETVVRFDPSKPYAEQFTPLKVEGKAPTEKQKKNYRQQGEKRGEHIERAADAAEKEAAENHGTVEKDPKAYIDLNGRGASIDFAAARVTAETATAITYEIPLRPEGKHPLPVDHFQLTVRVNKERHELEGAALRLLAPLRLFVVAKLTKGELQADYTVVDPKYPPMLARLSGNLAGSILFVKGGGTMEQTRTDFVRVKPFHERFGVKVGPLKALPF